MRSPFRMVVVPILLAIFVLSLLASPGLAYREYFTPEQRAQLEKIQTVFVDVLALTDKGTTDSAPLVDTVAQRLAEVG
ncbi:MAG: hypothetical protein JNL29_15625, partial [Nitrospira sp.]|nr:hypothetical protein [Nitrospira sp.]